MHVARTGRVLHSCVQALNLILILRQVAGATYASEDSQRCATPSPSMEVQLAVQQKLAGAERILSRAKLVFPIIVDVQFTVFTTVATPKQNTSNVPDAIIKQQMAVLNTHYAPSVRPPHPTFSTALVSGLSTPWG